MRYSTLYALWGTMFLLCAGLGMIPDPQGVGYAACLVCGLVFFAPPMVLVQKARREKQKKHLVFVRDAALLSLGLTVLAFAVNVFSAFGSDLMGKLLHVLLAVVSTPMFCTQIWVLSLLGWGVLLMSAREYMKEL